jgi:hypothetical protein
MKREDPLNLYGLEDERAENQQLKDKQFLCDLAATFGTPQGRRVFWWFLQRCHFLTPVHRSNASVYKVAAERDLGLELNGFLIAADPDLFAEILCMGINEAKQIKEPKDA